MDKTEITANEPEPVIPDSPKKPGIIRRLYDWVLSWANTPYGTPVLFVLAFMESSFFPIPPDVLQIALSAGKPKRSFWYATVSLIGSVLGASLGYFIGWKLWASTQYLFYNYIPGFTEKNFAYVSDLYHNNAFLSIFTAAFTPIPYKIFTIAAGVCEISLLTLIIASIIGRGARFYLVAALMYIFGPTVERWIDRYFNILTLLFTVLLIGGFIFLNYVLK